MHSDIYYVYIPNKNKWFYKKYLIIWNRVSSFFLTLLTRPAMYSSTFGPKNVFINRETFKPKRFSTVFSNSTNGLEKLIHSRSAACPAVPNYLPLCVSPSRFFPPASLDSRLSWPEVYLNNDKNVALRLYWGPRPLNSIDQSLVVLLRVRTPTMEVRSAEQSSEPWKLKRQHELNTERES